MRERQIGRSVADQLNWLVQKLLGLLSSPAIVGEGGSAARFRSELQVYKNRFANLTQEDSIDALVRKCLALCQDFFQETEYSKVNRESEYASIIDVLREAIGSLTDQAQLNGTLISSAQRFREIAQVRDLQELKQRIEEEVQIVELRVRERQEKSGKIFDSLTDTVKLLEAKLSQTEEQINLDTLTQVANRRYFDYALSQWVAEHRQFGPFVLVMIDVDNFKKVNDTYGHQAGDRVLFGIAQSVKTLVRDEDILARYGGEEFAILLRNITVKEAQIRVHKMLQVVRSGVYQVSAGHNTASFRISVSCGLAEFVQGDAAANLIERADAALYQAKRLGKDRVEVYQRERFISFIDQEQYLHESGNRLGN